MITLNILSDWVSHFKLDAGIHAVRPLSLNQDDVHVPGGVGTWTWDLVPAGLHLVTTGSTVRFYDGHFVSL